MEGEKKRRESGSSHFTQNSFFRCGFSAVCTLLLMEMSRCNVWAMTDIILRELSLKSGQGQCVSFFFSVLREGRHSHPFSAPS